MLSLFANFGIGKYWFSHCENCLQNLGCSDFALYGQNANRQAIYCLYSHTIKMSPVGMIDMFMQVFAISNPDTLYRPYGTLFYRYLSTGNELPAYYRASLPGLEKYNHFSKN